MITSNVYHIIASPLFRYNGIIEYIRAHIAKFGGQAVTDVKPKISLPFSVIYDSDFVFEYVPNTKITDWGLGEEQHVWLQWPDNLVEVLENLIKQLPKSAKIYTHCAISEQACQNLNVKTVFVQHESDIYYPQNRLSYLSDSWLERHQTLMLTARIGATMPATPNMKFKSVINTPYPLLHQLKETTDNLGEFVVVMDGSYRKGWDRYYQFWKCNGEPDTSVITREPDSRWPSAWKTVGFDFFQVDEKLQFIRNHQRAFIPSRSEVTCLALLECMSQVPTYVFNDSWTQPYKGSVIMLDQENINIKLS